mmetsp:Transcript_3140/g.4859  ORF Transcript_3140/g.4859 Transcript_3140/m.4859 type:complete len:166 (+) Transcript_3140:137-634(+)
MPTKSTTVCPESDRGKSHCEYGSHIAQNETFLPRLHPTVGGVPEKVVRVSPIKTKPYLYIRSKTYKKKKREIEKNKEVYTGIYKDGYLTPFERQKKEYAESRKNFIGGEFRRFSGVASEIPLRKEGCVRASGAYLPPIPVLHPKDYSKPKFGAWHPSFGSTNSLV